MGNRLCSNLKKICLFRQGISHSWMSFQRGSGECVHSLSCEKSWQSRVLPLAICFCRSGRRSKEAFNYHLAAFFDDGAMAAAYFAHVSLLFVVECHLPSSGSLSFRKRFLTCFHIFCQSACVHPFLFDGHPKCPPKCPPKVYSHTPFIYPVHIDKPVCHL